MTVLMTGVREYNEEYPVQLVVHHINGRYLLDATNEGGYNCTQVDILDLIRWLKENKPELLTLND